MIVILIGHKSRMGKDTVADYICDQYGARKFAFANLLKNICEMGEGKNRCVLRAVGDNIKKIFGNDFFAKHVYNEVLEYGNMGGEIAVVSDLRYISEYATMSVLSPITIGVKTNLNLSYGDDSHRIPHLSETELDNFEYDYTINNDSGIPDLYEKVKLVMESILGRSKSAQTNDS